MNRLDIASLSPQPGCPRVCIISTWNERYAPIAEIAVPNFEAYARRHGYAARMFPGEYHEDPSRPETYGDKGKFRLWYDVAGHADIVMWLDIDSLFMNMDLGIEPFMMHESFLWTYDENGPLSGLWIARTGVTTEKHLRKAYEMAAVENNVRHGVIEPNGISDQDAMTRLMSVPPFKSTFGHPRAAEDVGHCYERNYVPGKWLITFPGLPLEDKIAKMREWSMKANATLRA